MDTKFVKGNVIDYSGDLYEVLENHGNSGKVREYPEGEIICPFYWNFQGVKSVLVENPEQRLNLKEKDLIKLLKENLRIEVDENWESDTQGNTKTVKRIQIFYGDEEISSTTSFE